MSQLHFPFSAVSGQPLFKLALILNAINPSIGGVLVSGPRGSAKSTLARGFADILPSPAASLITLPLSATEDMLVGSLDLQQVLTNQEVNFKPGLLAKAHQGILYVDEVNLLADPLVDLLLDVSASGVNHVERDGVSHQHDAKFILLGTMNPEEGELRGQLLDRFGLSVQLTNQYSLEERVEIVTLREAFDQNVDDFMAQYETQQRVLQQNIIDASARLSSVTCAMAMRIEIAQRCAQANVDGLRADIVWLKSALAHAAWHERNEVLLEDINAVQSLVLTHRSQHEFNQPLQPPPQNDSAQNSTTEPNDGTEQNDRSSDNQQSEAGDAGASNEQSETMPESSAQSEWGAMPAKKQERVEVAPIESLTQPRFLRDKEAKKKQRTELISSINLRGNVQGGQRKSVDTGTQPDWFKTLVSALGQWPPAQIKYRDKRVGQPSVYLILLDTSGSILQKQQLGQAKSVILQIAEQAYQQRQQICIFGFGNEKVEMLMAQQKAPQQIASQLELITAGGGTPLRDMMTKVREYQQQSLKQNSAYQFQNYIITDGRVRQDIDDLPLQGQTLFIDTEDSSVKRGRAQALATQINAQYCTLVC